MKEKPSIWRRIVAIFSSALLALGINVASLATIPENTQDELVKAENVLDKEYLSFVSKYSDLSEIVKGIIPAPPVSETEIDDEVCDTMVPQGLEVTEDFFLITAYCGIEDYKKELNFNSFNKKNFEQLQKEQDHDVHNSVIYVFDRETKELISTLQLPDKNHVGGIAYDGNNIYIAKSTDKEVSIISYEKIKNLVEQLQKSGQKTGNIKYDRNESVRNNASFITTRNNNGQVEIWVGTFAGIGKEAILENYTFLDDGSLQFETSLKIEKFANGASFFQIDGTEYLLVTSSLGRNFDSRLFMSKIEQNKDGEISKSKAISFIMPPMLEEICSFENEDGSINLAIGTENYSKRYSVNNFSNQPSGIMIADLSRLVTLYNKKEKTENLPNNYAIETEVEELDEHKKKKQGTPEKDER